MSSGPSSLLLGGDAGCLRTRIGGALDELGTLQGDRVATLIQNSFACIAALMGSGRCARDVWPSPSYTRRTRASTCVTSSTDWGSRVVVVALSLRPRLAEVVDSVPDLAHVVVVDDDDDDAG